MIMIYVIESQILSEWNYFSYKNKKKNFLPG